jgi:hypothetical protein
MRRGSLALFLCSAGLALVPSGCGDEGSTADTISAIPKASFVKQANAICARTNQELTEVSEDFSKEKNLSEKTPPTEAQVGELVELALPVIRRQVEEIRALGAPAGDEERVNEILSAAEEAIEKGARDPNAIYGAGGGAFAKANRLATDYGLEQCGE